MSSIVTDSGTKHVTDKQHLATNRNSLQKRGGQADVQHGTLIDDKEIGLQRFFFILLEIPSLPLQ